MKSSQPGDQQADDVVRRLLLLPMLRTLLAVFLLFANVMFVIAVSPVVVDDLSGRSRDAAIITALFSASTVATQLLMPRLLRSESARWALAWGLLTMALAGAIGAVWSTSVSALFLSAALRGVGFGVGSVTSSLFIVTLAPEAERGKALGYFGVAATVPAIFAPSAGLLVFDELGAPEVFWITAGLGLAGALVAAVRPVRIDAPGEHSGIVGVLRQREVRRPFVAGVLAMVAFGGLLSYAPVVLPTSGFRSAATFFLVSGAARAAGRWASGSWIDKRNDAMPLLVGVVATAVGSAFLIGRDRVAFVILAALFVGAGLGIVLSAGYLTMIRGGPNIGLGLMSTLWNLSIDGGVAIGAIGFGIVATQSVGAVFVLLPFVVALAIPITRSIGRVPAVHVD